MIKAGDRVRTTRGMGLRVGRVTHVEGVVARIDGDYILVTLDFENVQLDRYLCEIAQIYKNGEWVCVR